MAVLSKGSLFDPVVVTDVFNKVRGKSSLAKLSGAKLLSFNGNSIFTFNMDSEIALVAENASKPHGGFSVGTVTVTPLKVVYQGRVSDEFMYASDEAKVDILAGFVEGFSAKLAAGLDKMAFHGVNPATGLASTLITSYFDGSVSNLVAYSSGTGGDAAIEAASQLLGDYSANGLAISKTFAGLLAGETKSNGDKKFPELAWGGQPERLGGLPCDVNATVGPDNYAVMGDFNAFRWGYAKDVTFETIEYGDPDNSGDDLKNKNQVMLRAEAYIGFAIIDPAAFALVKPKFAVKYDKNGGTGDAMTAGAYYADATATVSSNTYTPPATKSFSKWNTKSDGSGTDYAAAATFTMPAADVTLYAIWA